MIAYNDYENKPKYCKSKEFQRVTGVKEGTFEAMM
jgi:hypothetical protein